MDKFSLLTVDKLVRDLLEVESKLGECLAAMENLEWHHQRLTDHEFKAYDAADAMVTNLARCKLEIDRMR